MPSVLVGETHIPRDFARYARQYSFLEIDCEPGNVPGKARLQSCAAQAPEGFVFSLWCRQRSPASQSVPSVREMRSSPPSQRMRTAMQQHKAL